MADDEPDDDRTWDGRLRALDDPHGATVVVRRPGVEEPQYLLLHRQAMGVDFDGDWAWTAPSGCRRPGEPVHVALLRELAEETGIVGREPAMVDATLDSAGGGRWALFALDVEAGVEPTLVDPEHDRYVWVHEPEARSLITPDWVATNQIGRVHDVDTFDLTFAPVTAADVDLVVGWMRTPHVAEWWTTNRSDDEERAHLLRDLDSVEGTRQWLVSVGQFPVGYVQAYRLSDEPEYATKVGDLEGVGFDYLIGERALVGQGLGTQMVWALCRDVLRHEYPDAPRFVAAPSHRNHASRRMLLKCGFAEGVWFDTPADGVHPPDTEVAHTLDVRHWFGDDT